MVRKARGSSRLQPICVIPIPAGWSFEEGDKQLQVVISARDLPRYKLVYGKRGFEARIENTFRGLPLPLLRF